MGSVVESYRAPCFIPPYIENVISPESHAITQKLRVQRIYDVHNVGRRTVGAAANRKPQFHVYNAKQRETLPGKELNDTAVMYDADGKRALDGAHKVSAFFQDVYGRNSIDGHGMNIDSTVHYGVKYANAFWNGQQMVYGDGDKTLLNFTQDLDVIGHEMTHGVDEYTINLKYENQSGALNEALSDIFGMQIKQYFLKQQAKDSDWLIGDFMLADKPGKTRKQPIKQALRSMKDEPAYDNKVLGKDDQPKRMGNYKNLPNDDDHDNGGVHTNSGIPNHWFYLASTELGGYSWEKVGQVVYDVMKNKAVTPEASFTEFAQATIASAKRLYGEGAELKAVSNAWLTVEVLKYK